MKIKQQVDLIEFLNAVKNCNSEVYFETTQGDSLALGSQLCQYIFCSLASKPELLEQGVIRFQDPSDAAILTEFLE
ncbi:MAG: hypothetical protein ACK5ML_05855 [Lachnospiraceae bacterium]